MLAKEKTAKENGSEVSDKEAGTEQMDFEVRQNLLGVFSILLKIDKRVNLQNYRPKEEKNG